MTQVNKLLLLPVLMVLMVAMGCKPRRPSDIISPEKMEDIMVDYHMAQGMAENSDDRDKARYLYIQAVFSKHGVTEAEFDSSLVYYCGRSEQMKKIYERVLERVHTQAQLNGVPTEGEQDAFANLSENGDTANIWRMQSFLTMLPNKVQGRLHFSQKADSTFRIGDTFIWRFRTQFVSQGYMNDVIALLRLEYENDSVVCVNQTLTGNALHEMRFSPDAKLDSVALRNIGGYLYLAPREKGNKNFQMLMINDLGLIRIHKEVKPETLPADSLATDSLLTDSVQVDTLQAEEENAAHVRLTPQEMRDQQPREHRINVVKEKPFRLRKNSGNRQRRRMM